MTRSSRSLSSPKVLRSWAERGGVVVFPSERAATQGLRRQKKARAAAALHVNDMPDGTGVADPRDALQVRNTVKVKVVTIDQERRRLSLSIRQADGRFSRGPNV